MTLLIISAIIFITYIVTIIARFGIPESISDSFYLLEQKRKGSGIAFMFLCVAVTFTLCPYWLEVSPDHIRFLVFLSGGGLLLTGAAHEFKGFEREAHFVGATTCATASLLWLIFAGLWVVPLACFVIFSTITLFNRKNWLFWQELAAFTAVFLALFINNQIFKS